MKPKNICILGGGLSGLTQAWKQEQLGHRVTILESSTKIGGVLQTEEREGYLLDYGANSLSLRYQDTADKLDQMGVLPNSIDANSIANKRFIVRRGKLVALPLSFPSFFTSSFLSPMGKIRLLFEPFIPRGKEDANETVSSFIKRRLGQEALDYAANPFISGVYASKPETLHLGSAFPFLEELEKKYRSIFLGMFRKKNTRKRLPKTRLISFTRGMHQLTELISNKLTNTTIMTNKSVLSVDRGESDWKLTIQSKEKVLKYIHCDELISTLPIQEVKRVQWRNLNASDKLSELYQLTIFPLTLVYFGVDRSKIHHPLDGFGFLVPEKEKLSILGTLFSSTIFPSRAPDGKVLLTTFIGGERNPDLSLKDDNYLKEMVRNELSKLIGLQGNPEFFHVKRWPYSIPLPDYKMNIRKRAAEALSFANEGLTFSGSAFTGVSLPNCIDLN